MDPLIVLAIGIVGVAVMLWIGKKLHQIWCRHAYPRWLAMERKAEGEYLAILAEYERSKGLIDAAQDRLRERLKLDETAINERNKIEIDLLKQDYRAGKIDKEEFNRQLDFLRMPITTLRQTLAAEIVALEQGLRDTWEQEVLPAYEKIRSIALDRDWIWKHRLR